MLIHNSQLHISIFIFLIYFCSIIRFLRVNVDVLIIKNLPAMQVTRVKSLGWEDTPEKEMATHSSILAWAILCMKSLVVTKGWTQLTNTCNVCNKNSSIIYLHQTLVKQLTHNSQLNIYIVSMK